MREREREGSNTKLILTCIWCALNFISLLKYNNNVLFPLSPKLLYFILFYFIFCLHFLIIDFEH